MNIKKQENGEVKNKMFWIISKDDTTDAQRRVIEVDYIDIYSAGYVYNITEYLLNETTKFVYQRVKSCKNLLIDENQIKDYMSNESELCEAMADNGFYNKKMTKKELKAMEMLYSSSALSLQ